MCSPSNMANATPEQLAQANKSQRELDAYMLFQQQWGRQPGQMAPQGHANFGTLEEERALAIKQYDAINPAVAPITATIPTPPPDMADAINSASTLAQRKRQMGGARAQSLLGGPAVASAPTLLGGK